MIKNGTPKSNTLWLIIHQGFRLFSSFLVGIWLARYLGPTQFGIYNLSLSWMMIFSALGTMGLASVSIRFFADKHEHSPTILGTTLLTRFVSTVVSWILCLILFPLINQSESALGLLWVFAPVIILQSFDQIDFLFQAKLASRYSVLARIFSYTFSAGLTIWGILNHKDLIWFGVPFTIEFAFTALFYLFINQKFGIPLQSAKWSSPKFKELSQQAIPMLFSTFALMLYMKMDQVMLSNLSTSTETGFYAAAARITNLWIFLPAILTSSIFPKWISAFKNSKTSFHNISSQTFDLMIAISIPIALLLSLSAKLIIHILYGSEYSPSIPVLIVHVWILPTVFLRVSFDRLLVVLKQTHFSLVAHLSILTINFSANLFLIPIYGAIGAAVASFLSIFIGITLIPLLFKTTRSISKQILFALFFFPRLFLGKIHSNPLSLILKES